MVQTSRQLDLWQAINDLITLSNLHRPCDEGGNVLSISQNLLAGDRCLEHFKYRRQDEAYLNVLGAERNPGPPSGDQGRHLGDGRFWVVTEASTFAGAIRRLDYPAGAAMVGWPLQFPGDW
ncbi:hypothetical protein Pla8534_29910 [Lignipirellula cremea]|uniref:Uncharacterized protein n=1 Tax=Lignipirellula cremea TaxID=2528010 RepID=A0A518DTL2_9BACT|nr:hypothetical protein Pla8534_29910 [Lignipirellula cremea]